MRKVPFLFIMGIGCFIIITESRFAGAAPITISDTLVLKPDSMLFDLKDSAFIKFPELTIRFSINPGFKWIMPENKFPDDTLDIQVDPGTTLQGKKIVIESTMLTDMTFEQGYRTILFIQNKGQQIGLMRWKQYISDWMTLAPLSPGIFSYSSYSDIEKSRFSLVNMTELRNYLAAKPEYGEPIAEMTDRARSVHDDPFSVGIGIESLRITGIRKDDGVRISKTISIVIEKSAMF